MVANVMVQDALFTVNVIKMSVQIVKRYYYIEAYYRWSLNFLLSVTHPNKKGEHYFSYCLAKNIILGVKVICPICSPHFAFYYHKNSFDISNMYHAHLNNFDFFALLKVNDSDIMIHISYFLLFSYTTVLYLEKVSLCHRLLKYTDVQLQPTVN